MGLTVILDNRWDINLDALYRVAWQRESVRISDSAMQKIASSRASFLQLINEDPGVVIYGVTTSMGEQASQRLTPEQRDRHARIKPFPAAISFGDYLPDRVVRGICLARLTNFVEGHAATTPRMAHEVVQMLQGGPMPQIAAAGQGGAGEILALYPLFAQFSMGFDLEVKERGSLINGSPCAAALVADAAIAARRRFRLALKTFALSIEAFRAPLEHYDEALDTLWGDKDEAAALQGLREFLVGGTDTGRRNYQAPVSYRIVPRVLGHAHRAAAGAVHAATVSLSSISDNPVYLPPDDKHPLGRCISTGGYHNSMAAPALDDLAAIWADICLLCDRHSAKLLNGRVSQMPDMLVIGREPGDSDGRGHVGYVPFAAAGYIELAKSAAQRTFIPGSDSMASGQDDVATPCFLAWSKEQRAGRCMDASLAMLAVVASQALYVTDRQAPPALRDFLDMIRTHVKPLVEDRVLGPELDRLTDAFTAQVFSSIDRGDIEWHGAAAANSG